MNAFEKRIQKMTPAELDRLTALAEEFENLPTLSDGSPDFDRVEAMLAELNSYGWDGTI